MGAPSGRLAARAATVVAPEDLGTALVADEHAGDHEQQVREPVEIFRRLRIERRGVRLGRARGCRVARGRGLAPDQRPETPLGAPADGSCEMTGRRRGSAARQDELLERRQRLVEIVERALEARDVLAGEHASPWNAELAAEIEQVVLDRRETGPDGLREIGRSEHQAQRTVELIDRAVGLDAGVIFRHAAAVAEAGRAVVAGARVDLAEAVSHARIMGPDPSARETTHAYSIPGAAGGARCSASRQRYPPRAIWAQRAGDDQGGSLAGHGS